MTGTPVMLKMGIKMYIVQKVNAVTGWIPQHLWIVAAKDERKARYLVVEWEELRAYNNPHYIAMAVNINQLEALEKEVVF